MEEGKPEQEQKSSTLRAPVGALESGGLGRIPAGGMGVDSVLREGTNANPTTSSNEPTFTITGTASFIRRLASLSTEADRKLRAQCPTAFLHDVWLSGRLFYGPRLIGVGQGAGKIWLADEFVWSIKTSAEGTLLVAHERV